jgi:mitochondrial fission protein ELM1
MKDVEGSRYGLFQENIQDMLIKTTKACLERQCPGCGSTQNFPTTKQVHYTVPIHLPNRMTQYIRYNTSKDQYSSLDTYFSKIPFTVIL